MLDVVLSAFIIITLAPAVLMFLQRRLLNAVVCLAASAVGSSLLFLYMGQTLAALLQLFVFVGGLSTYLVVAVASEEKRAGMLGKARFLIAAVAVGAGLALVLKGIDFGQQQAANGFVGSAEIAFGGQYALLYAASFLVFAAAAGSVLVLRRFSKMVV